MVELGNSLNVSMVEFHPPTPEHVGLIMYTSGSTGKPKVITSSLVNTSVSLYREWCFSFSANGESGSDADTSKHCGCNKCVRELLRKCFRRSVAIISSWSLFYSSLMFKNHLILSCRSAGDIPGLPPRCAYSRIRHGGSALYV